MKSSDIINNLSSAASALTESKRQSLLLLVIIDVLCGIADSIGAFDDDESDE